MDKEWLEKLQQIEHITKQYEKSRDIDGYMQIISGVLEDRKID